MAKHAGLIQLADILEPILNAGPDDDDLDHSIDLVAEALAALGALILGPDGQIMTGVTDEVAVLGAMNTYGRALVQNGRLDDAMEVMELMERINRVRDCPPTPGL